MEITLKTVTAAQLAQESDRLKRGYCNVKADYDDDHDGGDDDDDGVDDNDGDIKVEQEEEEQEDKWWSARESKSGLSNRSRDMVQSVRSHMTTLPPITDRDDKSNISKSISGQTRTGRKFVHVLSM